MFPIWIIDFFSFLFIGGPIEPPHSLCIRTRHFVERPSPRGRAGAAASPRATGRGRARRGVGPPARPFPWNRAIEQPTIFMKM
ncbi:MULTISPECIES: hypothetical protein [Burkholderia]|uniref:hypothetical protein n=1 Tax=Burkholderia TaxID=32008 RepID=UPI00034C4780|nr:MULTISPECIES: hypothetical protein [Burkholderia]MDY7818333.1 hypothetical protein [Burkholderia pseudomallei]MDY7861298.1 hypothetical protein [Burkholderia pseudomallei]